jgi:hypothetical protein
MVLATGLSFVMLFFGGGGGLVNLGYGLNALIHNTSWVTAHFHLIFGGAVVIMYFAIAYEIWPQLTRRAAISVNAQRLQLWLWFCGMMVMSLPWHWLGLQANGAGWRSSTTPIQLLLRGDLGSSFPLLEVFCFWRVRFFLYGISPLSAAGPSPPWCPSALQLPFIRPCACRQRSTASAYGMRWC